MGGCSGGLSGTHVPTTPESPLDNTLLCVVKTHKTQCPRIIYNSQGIEPA